MKVFLSYASSDEKLARKIGDGLSQSGLTVYSGQLGITSIGHHSLVVSNRMTPRSGIMLIPNPLL